MFSSVLINYFILTFIASIVYCSICVAALKTLLKTHALFMRD